MLLTLMLQAPVDPGILHWDGFASLGVGGVLAGMMFFFYRQDRKASEERHERLTLDHRSMIQENTQAMTRLCETIERSGRYDRTD